MSHHRSSVTSLPGSNLLKTPPPASCFWEASKASWRIFRRPCHLSRIKYRSWNQQPFSNLISSREKFFFVPVEDQVYVVEWQRQWYLSFLTGEHMWAWYVKPFELDAPWCKCCYCGSQVRFDRCMCCSYPIEITGLNVWLRQQRNYQKQLVKNALPLQLM